MSKAKKPKKISLHKSFKREERRIYDSFRSIFEYFKAQLCRSSFVSRKFLGKVKSPLDTIKEGRV